MWKDETQEDKLMKRVISTTASSAAPDKLLEVSWTTIKFSTGTWVQIFFFIYFFPHSVKTLFVFQKNATTVNI